jgi:glycosyltransferase involved in cell wall biosynthesis
LPGPAKLDLLAGASCLLNPLAWDEPFGLVMVEALACGTPVVATARGSVPELIDDGRTGFVGADEAELAGCLPHVAELDRSACRKDAAERFSAERMVADHVALYARLIERNRSPRAA